MKADVAQATVDLVHRYLLLLIDGLLVALPADMGAEELLAVQQCHNGVIEFHKRHVAPQRQVADRERVVPVRGKDVLATYAAARAKGHAVAIQLLVALAGVAAYLQRDHHVAQVAVRGGDRGSLGIAHGLCRNNARCIHVLIDVGGRHLQPRGIGVIAGLVMVIRQQRRYIDVERQQVTHGVGVLAPVQTAQLCTAGSRARVAVECALEPGD